MTVFEVLLTVAAAMLVAAAALTLLRIALGPTMLNRTVGTDVLVSVLIVGIALRAAQQGDTTTLPILVVLSLVGFSGSVTVARFAGKESKRDGGRA